MLLIAGIRISALSQPPTGFLPKPVAILLPQALPPPPFGSNPSSLPPYYPMPPTPSSPSPRFIPTGPSGPFQWHSLSTTPSISVPRPPPTLVPSFTVSPCPFRPSSVLQTSVGPGLLIPSTFYTPLPSTNPPTPLYLTHKTPPTLTHWWFSTWEAQPRHPTDRSPPLTHQPIDLHLPTP